MGRSVHDEARSFQKRDVLEALREALKEDGREADADRDHTGRHATVAGVLNDPYFTGKLPWPTERSSNANKYLEMQYMGRNVEAQEAARGTGGYWDPCSSNSDCASGFFCYNKEYCYGSRH